MRIKKDFLPCFLLVIVFLCFVFLSPAFADMKKVDEAELAQTNASVTGTSVKYRTNCVEKNGICSETKQDTVTFDKGVAVSSPSVNVKESIGLDLNITGQTTFQFYFGPSASNVTGGITSVKSY